MLVSVPTVCQHLLDTSKVLDQCVDNVLGYVGEFADSMSAPTLLRSKCFSAKCGHGMRHVLWSTCKVCCNMTQKVQAGVLG